MTFFSPSSPTHTTSAVSLSRQNTTQQISHNGFLQGPRQAGQGYPSSRPYRYEYNPALLWWMPTLASSRICCLLLGREGVELPQKIGLQNERRATAFSPKFGTDLWKRRMANNCPQVLVVVSLRSVSSSWTTRAVPSSVTSRVPVRFNRFRRACDARKHVEYPSQYVRFSRRIIALTFPAPSP